MSLTNIYYPLSLAVLLSLMFLAQRLLRETGTKIQLLLLLLASYAFVLYADWRFGLSLFAVTLFTYLDALLIDNFRGREVPRKICLFLGIIVLLSFLGYFKYSGFFLESLGKLINMKFAGERVLHLFLPLGISFYVFSTLAYLVDVYRGEYPAERNFIIFALYIAFFPKLLAGPIVRGRDFMPQIRAYGGLDLAALQTGLQIFVFGFFKKKVLADHLAVFVDDVFHAPVAFSSGTILLAVVSYSLQIYFDFSGYSDMAIGSARMLGFDFKPNFNLPYVSENISDFWGRWHISLSSWFRDYLYIPLGGNRKEKSERISICCL